MESEILKQHLLKFRSGQLRNNILSTAQSKESGNNIKTSLNNLQRQNSESNNQYLKDKPLPERWDEQITELENYFAGISLPCQPINLEQCSTITNITVFLDSHFEVVKANNGNFTFIGYLNRLKELKQILSLNKSYVNQ